jgi:hypothetical protein
MNCVALRLRQVPSRVVRLWKSESGEGAVSQVMMLGVAAMILVAVMSVVGVNSSGAPTGDGFLDIVLGKIGDLLGGGFGGGIGGIFG